PARLNRRIAGSWREAASSSLSEALARSATTQEHTLSISLAERLVQRAHPVMDALLVSLRVQPKRG
ncbi:hypothetical protein A2U01_0100513, partial [Trifolium medium]|nr:hypothetical protein [Trifolium medium]